jgi:cytochrome c biogenesis protein CcdA
MAVNERLANAVLHHLPQINPGIRAADKFWKAVGPLVLVGGFVALIWWPWWTPIVGFVLASLIYRSALKSAADFVADAAKADPALCQSLEAAGVIRTA